MPKPTKSAASLAAAGLMVIGAAVLAGCGLAGASGAAQGLARTHRPTRQSDSALVCADPAAVTRVRVVRTPSRSQLGQAKPMPRQSLGVTVRDPAAARTLARAVCGLPATPHSAWFCPMDVGGGYVLEFMSGLRQFRPVIVRASGCEEVTGFGAGGARSAMKTPQFWTMLAQLTGIRAPAHSP
jgi:hypothetical protein